VIAERDIEGFRAITLTAPEASVEAAFVPDAGMVGCSLRHRGAELLGQRGGLAAYAANRSTMGIPLLHPWANRLGAARFGLAGREVDLGLAEPPPSTDPEGLPIHGLLAAAPGWRVTKQEETGGGGRLAARFDFSARPGLMRAFPFPHEIEIEATLDGSRLAIETTVTATGDAPVPVSFGYHPYFQLPGLDRADWRVEIPVAERLVLDERMLPTGEREPVALASGPLGSQTFDDAYLAPPASDRFSLQGGGRRIEVAFERGFPYAQIYAPLDDDVIAIEPMTAPTNALVTDGPALPVIDPGQSYSASFSITVAGEGAGRPEQGSNLSEA
jgi:aldose 1-epimerase